MDEARRGETIEMVTPDGSMRAIRYTVEETRATRPGSPDPLLVTRNWGLPAVPQFQNAFIFDRCSLSVTGVRARAAPAVRATLRDLFGHAARDLGEQPIGDGLLPIFGERDWAFHWTLPQHDLTLQARSDDLAIEVLAMLVRPPESDIVKRLRNAGITP